MSRWCWLVALLGGTKIAPNRAVLARPVRRQARPPRVQAPLAQVQVLVERCLAQVALAGPPALVQVAGRGLPRLR